MINQEWAIFPCHSINKKGLCTCGTEQCISPGKHPLIPTGGNGASKDPAQIAAWWKRWPYANMAVSTGKASGLIVVDVDAGGEESLLGFELPETVEVITGSGGRHLYYKRPETELKYKTVRGILQGVDIRADGGYVIAPPSKHFSGRTYQWDAAHHPDDMAVADCPEWLLEKISEVLPGPNSRVWTPSGKLPSDIVEILSYIPSDAEDTWTKVGMALHYEDPSSFELFDDWSKKSSKYSTAAAKKKWDYFDRRKHSTASPASLATIRHLATLHGWTDPLEIAGAEISDRLLQSHKAKMLAAGLSRQTARKILPPAHPIPQRGLIKDICDHILITQERPLPLLAVGAVVPFLGVLMGGKYCSPSNLRTNVYIVGLAGSAIGKNHARTILAEITSLAAIGKRMGASTLASGAALLSEIEEEKNRFYMIDEFGLFLQSLSSQKDSHKREIMTNLMIMYSTAGSTWYGTGRAGKDKQAIVIHNPNVGLYGTSTHTQFYAALSSASGLDGSLARMIVIDTGEEGRPPRNPDYRMQPIPTDIIDQVKKLLDKHGAGNLNPDPIKIPYADGIEDLFYALDDSLDVKMTTDASKAIYGRVKENAIRLALIHAVSCGLDEIGAESAIWAQDIVLWSAQKLLLQIDRHVADNSQESNVKKLLRLIGDSKDGITKTELTRKSQGMYKRERQDIIDDLIESGMITVVVIPKKDSARGADGIRFQLA